LVVGHATEEVGVPERKVTVLFFVFERVLGHAFPTYDVVLVEDLSVEYRFAEDHRNEQKAKQDQYVGDEFLVRKTVHGGLI
jgi:hypothetical protein